MAKQQPKKVVVHSKIRSPWRLGSYWFTYGPNSFSRDEYRAFEVHPLFLRQLSAGKMTVEDPEYPPAPKDPVVEAPAVESEAPAAPATEGGEDAEGDAPAKGKGKGKVKSPEVSPS